MQNYINKKIMKPLNNYISEGFFNNVKADKESMKESIVSRILNNLAEINKISKDSCYLLICEFGYNSILVDKEGIDKYFKVGDNTLLQSNMKTKKHGLCIDLGHGHRWNNECLKKLADTLEYFDPDKTTILLKINEEESGVSMKNITDALKGRLPKMIFSIILSQCNIEDWSWLDGVDEICNLDIYDSFVRSFKGIQPGVDNILINGDAIFADTNYFPHVTRTVMLGHDSIFQNKLSVVKDNMVFNAKLYR